MKFRKILSVALSAVMLAGSSSVAVSAKETEKKYDYVALGDSITSGFGLENPTGKFVDEPTLITTATNLAATAYRAEDVAKVIVDETHISPIATWMIGQDRIPEMLKYHEIYQKYLSEAELISILIGGNDIAINMLAPMCTEKNPIVSALGTTLIFILAGIKSEVAVQTGKQIIENNKDSIDYQTVKEAAEYIKENMNIENYIDISAENVKKVVEAIKTVNDTADIALLGMYNAYGNSLELDGQVKNLPNVVKNIFKRAIEEIAGKDIDSQEKKSMLLSVISDEITYPMQYLLMGRTIDPAMKSLNQKLKKIADETGCIFIDVYDISNECNIDPHPNAQGHHEIADIMYNELSGMIEEKMTPPAERVLLNRAAVTLEKGQNIQLNARVFPSAAIQSVKWSSSNRHVATVDENGFVTAKKAGTAVITAKTSNGKKITCTINVKKPDKKSFIMKLINSVFKR